MRPPHWYGWKSPFWNPNLYNVCSIIMLPLKPVMYVIPYLLNILCTDSNYICIPDAC